MKWVRVYDLRTDTLHVRHMQEASLRRPDIGLSTSPALIGSDQWWEMAEDGRLVTHEMSGKITKVYWASMGDWPEFELTSADGRSNWTRQGDYTRYVEGLQVRLAYVLHAWKHPNQYGLGTHAKQVTFVDVEESLERSDPRVPGPGGIGLREPANGQPER
jgi:hypothetical protein